MSRDRIATIVSAIILIFVFHTIWWLQYDFSVTGASYLVGNILGAGAFITIIWLAVQRRRPRFFGPTMLGVLAVVLAIGHWRDVSDGLQAREAKPYLDGTKTFEQIQAAAREHPDNKLLRLFSTVYDLRIEAQEKLNNLMLHVEPPGLKALTPEVATDPTQLNTFIDQLRQAEDNARDIVGKYQQMIVESRQKLADQSKDFASPETGNQTLVGFDKSAVVATRVAERQSSDLVAIYQAMRAQAIFLQQRMGTFKIEDGHLAFKDQTTTDAFNALQAPIVQAGARYRADLDAINKYRQQQEAKMRGPF